MAARIREENAATDRRIYTISIGNNHTINTTVTASHSVVDEWITETLNNHNFGDTTKLIVGLGIQWRIVRGHGFNEIPPATLQLCTGRNRCLIYQLCHSHTPSEMLRYFINHTEDTVTFVSLRCPQDFNQKLELVHSVHFLKLTDDNKPVDLRPRVARTQESGVCPSLLVIARRFLDGYELDIQNTTNNWMTHHLSISQVVFASVIAYLPCAIGYLKLRSAKITVPYLDFKK